MASEDLVPLVNVALLLCQAENSSLIWPLSKLVGAQDVSPSLVTYKSFHQPILYLTAPYQNSPFSPVPLWSKPLQHRQNPENRLNLTLLAAPLQNDQYYPWSLFWDMNPGNS